MLRKSRDIQGEKDKQLWCLHVRVAVESGVTGDLGGDRQLSSEQTLGTEGETTSCTSKETSK